MRIRKSIYRLLLMLVYQTFLYVHELLNYKGSYFSSGLVMSFKKVIIIYLKYINLLQETYPLLIIMSINCYIYIYINNFHQGCGSFFSMYDL